VTSLTRERIILLAAHFFFFLNFSELILLPKYFQHIGISPSDIGMLMGAFNLSVLLALPVAGIVSEKIGRKILFIAGTTLMALPSALYVRFSGILGALFLLRVLQGIGFSLAFGIIGAMMARDADTSERKYLLGMLTVVGISTHAVGPFLGEYLRDVFGFQMLFSSAAVFGLTASALGVFLPGHAADGTRQAHAVDLDPGVTASSIVLGVIFGSVVIFLPPYLHMRGVMNSSPFFITFVAGSLLMWTVLYPFMKSWPEAFLKIVSSALLVLLLACVQMTDTGVMLIPLSLLFGIGYGYLYPTLNAGLIEMNPACEGLANALFVWCFNLGMLLASVGFGFTSERIGYEATFQIIALLGFVLLVTTGFLAKKKVL